MNKKTRKLKVIIIKHNTRRSKKGALHVLNKCTQDCVNFNNYIDRLKKYVYTLPFICEVKRLLKSQFTLGPNL